MRKLDKCERFLLKFTNDVVFSNNSTYFKFGNFKVRVSDHMTKDGDYNISILIPDVLSPDSYCLGYCDSKRIVVINYNQLKSLIKSIVYFAICKGDCEIKPTPSDDHYINKINNLQLQLKNLNNKYQKQLNLVRQYQCALENKNKSNKDIVLGINKSQIPHQKLKQIEELIKPHKLSTQ